MRPISVRLYDTLERGAQPLADMGIDPATTAIAWTSTLPGGCNTLTVGIEEPDRRSGWGPSYGFIPEPISLKPFSHVVVSVGNMVVWEGRLSEDEIGPLGGQAFIADGYGIAGTSADYYESSDTTLTTTGPIIEAMLAESATLLSRGVADEWSDPSVAHSKAEFDGLNLAEALDQVIKEGGSGYVTWDWWVTIGRRLALVPRVAPAEVDYLVDYEPGRVTIRRDYREIATTASVSYTDSGVEFQTSDETNATTATYYRINRRVRVQGDQMTATTAAQLRTMELARRGTPNYAITIERGPSDDDWLTTPGGAQVPHWAVQAGQWVQVANLPPQIIVSVQYDPVQGLSCDLGAPSRLDFSRYLASTCAEVNKLVKGINPKTGGRRRANRQMTDTGAPVFATLADAQTWATSLRTQLRDKILMS